MCENFRISVEKITIQNIIQPINTISKLHVLVKRLTRFEVYSDFEACLGDDVITVELDCCSSAGGGEVGKVCCVVTAVSAEDFAVGSLLSLQPFIHPHAIPPTVGVSLHFQRKEPCGSMVFYLIIGTYWH